jgi:hypothetical protein
MTGGIIRAHQWHSAAFSGTQRHLVRQELLYVGGHHQLHSAALSGTQWHSAAPGSSRAPLRWGHHQLHSAALSGTQRHLVRQELLHDGLRSQRLQIRLSSNVDDDHERMQLDGLLENLTCGEEGRAPR